MAWGIQHLEPWSRPQQQLWRSLNDEYETLEAAQTMAAMSRSSPTEVSAAASNEYLYKAALRSVRAHQGIPPSALVPISSSSQPRSSKRTSRAAILDRQLPSLPSDILLLKSSRIAKASGVGLTVDQSVPEFLCQLYSILCNPSYSDLISWVVPPTDESDHTGGGLRGIGKIVVHNPTELQDSVLGEHYGHSKYSSFQRQLNYFGFKKRIHGGKRGKLSPCSYVHDGLNEDMASLFTLKRRPPARKRPSESVEGDGSPQVSVGQLPLRKRMMLDSNPHSTPLISSGEECRDVECSRVSDETDRSNFRFKESLLMPF